MMEIGYDSAQLHAADLHAACATIDLGRNGVRSEIPLPIWSDQQRFTTFLNHKTNPGRASEASKRIHKDMDSVCLQIK